MPPKGAPLNRGAPCHGIIGILVNPALATGGLLQCRSQYDLLRNDISEELVPHMYIHGLHETYSVIYQLVCILVTIPVSSDVSCDSLLVFHKCEFVTLSQVWLPWHQYMKDKIVVVCLMYQNAPLAAKN